GYVMAPGSVHPDGPTYKWGNDEPIRPAPAWLLEKILAAQSASGKPTAPRQGNGETKIPCGCRDATLTSFAGSMRRRGMGHGAVEAALQVVNREQCVVPLPENDVAR